MKLLHSPQISNPTKCPYLDGQQFTQQFFYAYDLLPRELDELLLSGWRKFGLFYFRPHCASCQACTPIRIPVATFKPSKDQRRNLKKNVDIISRPSSLTYRREIFDLYCLHSQSRFKNSDQHLEDDFKNNFFAQSTHSYLIEYTLGPQLVAVGFVDESIHAINSIYFIFDPTHSQRGLGTLGVLREIQLAKEKGLQYYYLGYWMASNPSLAYKARFSPHQLYDWSSKIWKGQKVRPSQPQS